MERDLSARKAVRWGACPAFFKIRQAGSRRWASFMGLLVFSSFAAIADVGLDDLTEIRELTQAGDYAAALEKHLFFHEESESSVGMGGVRLSFALADWIRLGYLYPPAREALIRLKDEDKALLLAGQGQVGIFRDFSSINEALALQDETLEVFRVLDEQYPEQCAGYYLFIEDMLFEREEYEIIAKYMGNPLRKFETLRHLREVSTLSLKSQDARSLEVIDRNFVEGVLRLLKVLVALGRRAEAIDVQERAMAYHPHQDIAAALP